MLLINIAEVNDEIYVYFLDKGDITQYKIKSDHYALRKISEDESKKKNPRLICSGYIYGNIYDQKPSFFEKVSLDKKDEQLKKYELFDYPTDICNELLLKQRISLYVSYQPINKPLCSYIEKSDLKKIDKTPSLKRISLNIEVESSDRMMGPVPIWTTMHAGLFHKEFYEIKFFKTQRVTKISTFISEEDSKATFEGNETTLIRKFLLYFREIDPDVVEIYNWTKIHYLYQRCVFHTQNGTDVDLEKDFLLTINRLPVKGDGIPSVDQLREYCFPLRVCKDSRTLTRNWVNYSDISNVSKKYGFSINLFNRFCVSYYTQTKDEGLVKPDDLVALSNQIEKKKILELILKITGEELYIPYCYYYTKMILSYNLIKKHNPSLIFPYVKNKSDVKIKGGITMECKGRIYYSDDGYNLYNIDINSCYPSILNQFNASPDTQSKDDVNAVMYEYDNGTKIGFVKKEKRIGAIPNVITYLIQKRRFIKEKIKKETNDDIRESLQVEEKVVKEETNIIFGALGCQSNNNRLAAPRIASLVTSTGQKIWKILSGILSEIGEVVFGDTDGLVLFTNKTIEDINFCLKEFTEKTGFVADIKGKYQSFVSLSKKSWVAINEDGDFVNTGVITKIDNLITKEIKLKLLKYVLTTFDQDVTKFKEMIKEILTNSVSMDSFKKRMPFAPDMKNNQPVDVSKEIIKINDFCCKVLNLWIGGTQTDFDEIHGYFQLWEGKFKIMNKD